jgi:hypothetical protein
MDGIGLQRLLISQHISFRARTRNGNGAISNDAIYEPVDVDALVRVESINVLRAEAGVAHARRFKKLLDTTAFVIILYLQPNITGYR